MTRFSVQILNILAAPRVYVNDDNIIIIMHIIYYIWTRRVLYNIGTTSCGVRYVVMMKI